MPIERLALILGAMALSSSAFAAGIDSRSYTCTALQSMIVMKGFFDREFDDTEEFPGQGSSRQNAIAYLCKEIKRLRPLVELPGT